MLKVKIITFILAAVGCLAIGEAAEIVVTVEPSDAEVTLIPQKPETTTLQKHTVNDGKHVWQVDGAPGDMLSLYVKRAQYVTALEFVPASGKELKISLKYSTEYAEALQNSAFREKIDQETAKAREEAKERTRTALLAKYKDRGDKVLKAFKNGAPAIGMPAEMIIAIFGDPVSRSKSNGAGGSEENLNYAQPPMIFYFVKDRLVRWELDKDKATP